MFGIYLVCEQSSSLKHDVNVFNVHMFANFSMDIPWSFQLVDIIGEKDFSANLSLLKRTPFGMMYTIFGGKTHFFTLREFRSKFKADCSFGGEKCSVVSANCWPPERYFL